MRITLKSATLMFPLLLTGCNGAFWGNLVVLGITVGIFLATLSLGRSREATRTADESASSTSSRS